MENEGVTELQHQPTFDSSVCPLQSEGAIQSPFIADGRWWLVHTKARNEKALATDLQRLSIPYFLPLARVPRRYAGKRSFVRLPLFPGYLFLRGEEEQRYATISTRRAVSVIRVDDQELLHRELQNLERVVSSEAPVDLYPGIRKGQLCRIVHGSLKGAEGVVLRRRGICTVYLCVTMLGQSAELEIDPSLLEICEQRMAS